MPGQEETATSAKSALQQHTEISLIEPPAPDDVEIPEQKEHYQLPTRFEVGLRVKALSRNRRAADLFHYAAIYSGSI